MKTKLGRNDSCHCGSGKKYKSCHGLPNDKYEYLWPMVIIVVLIISWFFFFEFDQSVPEKYSSSNSLNYQKSNFLSSPPEAAPPGKVWSPEHGHWHDEE